ncbi:predicted protein [Naegleria gruberi]|uniref:Predicted protein n=1 Tax=Naegleria gruberi TaxID=5762 RepID=D2VL82_NAEGR|nr:uncharacterized protein NAEGRDRAFT_69687 [Naegleria gruberi]EFC42267.1 predicted protein [Naegleria gruberi]|eukprot:XP_002675011.1 predicted protein [Naegleria gruberi strain NEG-M]
MASQYNDDIDDENYEKKLENAFNSEKSLLLSNSNNNISYYDNNVNSINNNYNEIPILVEKKRFSNFTKIFQSESMKRVRRWIAFIVGCFIMTASGTPYSFSSISPSLKKTFLLSQSEGTSANLGSNFSFIFSFVNDIFGSRISSLLAGACLFFSYFSMSLIVTGNLPFIDPYIAFCFLMFLMGSACGGGFISSISTSMKNFPERNRGLVIGVLSSCYGISSAIYSGAYLYIFQQDLEIYLIFCAVLGGVVVMIMGPIFLDSKANSLTINSNNNKNNQNDNNNQIENENESSNVDNVDNLHDVDDNVNNNLKENNLKENETLKERITKIELKLKENEAPNVNPFKMLISLDFYLSFLITFLFAGSGIVIINNLGSIVQSYGGKNGEQNNMVIVFSCCNCIGRILFGFVSDKLFNPLKNLTRITFIGITILMMMIGQFIFSFLPLPGFYPLIIFVGLSYGGFMALNPSFISERFGAKYYGLNSTIHSLSSSCGSYAFSTGLAGHLYQLNIKEPRMLTCHGRECYELTFIILSVLNGLAFLLTLILHWRTLNLYHLLKFRRHLLEKLNLLQQEEKQLESTIIN